MASDLGGKIVANRGKRSVTADYGQRAALALERCIPGPNRDKAIARLFNVSDRMARYLRCGQYWTAERLSQASAAIKQFDSYISAPNIHARLDEMEAELTALREQLKSNGGGNG